MPWPSLPKSNLCLHKQWKLKCCFVPASGSELWHYLSWATMFLLAKLINWAFRAGPFLSSRKKLHHISYQSASNLSLWTVLKESLAREKTGIDTPGQHNLDFRSACGERNGICETDGQQTAVSGQRADFHPQSPEPVCINRPKDIRTAVCTRALGFHLIVISFVERYIQTYNFRLLNCELL